MRCPAGPTHTFPLVFAVLLWSGCARRESAGFLTTLGNDTLAVEQVAWSSRALSGVLLHTVPRTTRYTYDGDLDGAGRLTRFHWIAATPGDTTRAPVEGEIQFGDTVAMLVMRRGEERDTTQVPAARGAVPMLPQGFGFYQLASRAAVPQREDSVPVTYIWLSARRAFASALQRRGPDSVAADYFGLPLMLRVDAQGNVLGADGRRTTQQTLTVRQAIDLDRYEAAFVARERAGAVGVLSPRDTVRAEVGTARIEIDYGRPHARGRTIFGGVVPLDTIWRTGANAATQFRTSADLQIGKTRIPAGFYSLWTIPRASGASLVINSETGQWGTAHKPALDLWTIPLAVESLAEPVEQFTIQVTEVGPRKGLLTLSWDRTRWAVPFEVR